MKVGDCKACNELEETSLETARKGFQDKQCKSLQNDTGLNPDLSVLNNDCEDLNNLNDCLIESFSEEIETYDDCDWKEYERDQNSNIHTVFKALICAICGLWKNIHDLWADLAKAWKEINWIKNQINLLWDDSKSIWQNINEIWKVINNLKSKDDDLQKQIDNLKNLIVDRDGYFTLTKTYTYTVPKDKFVPTWGTNKMQFSGEPSKGECFIKIPVAEMDYVDTVMAQPQVVGAKVHAVTVAIQSAILQGTNYEVNFDTYLIQGNPASGHDIPFAVPVKFIVVGRKKFK